MIDRAFSFIAPHHCCGCGIVGALLCDNCKYDIIDEPFYGCFVCDGPTSSDRTICQGCDMPYERAWCVGVRSDTLKRLIDAFKFSRAKSAHRNLAMLLDETLPQLPPETIIVPIPTVPAHVRERGYDHMLLITRQLARKRNLQNKSYLARISNTTQRGANREERNAQASKAFGSKFALNPDIPYLLVDDVSTTGATLEHAARALRQAGAKTIWVAAVAKQSI